MRSVYVLVCVRSPTSNDFHRGDAETPRHKRAPVLALRLSVSAVKVFLRRRGIDSPADFAYASHGHTRSHRVPRSSSHPDRPRRLAWPRTPAFHAGDTGSNPVGDALSH